MKLLLVEDDTDLAAGLTQALTAESFVVSTVRTGADAKAQITSFGPDLIVLDLGLPDMDGIEVLKFVRRKADPLPVLILTARNAVDDKVQMLDIGADDYLAKPFDMPELLARLRVMSRRLGTASSSEVTINGVMLDTAAHKAFVDGVEINLPRKEYRVLKLLMEDAGRVKTKGTIEDHLYEWGEAIGSNAIEVHVSNLRKKLPANFIKTIRGVGYTINKKGG
ncbi:MAG: response regulator transcription factor [Porticoccaceae bacterium]|nr:response regulator transcription factor [Pseudomonadales bacterium]MCP5172726.1 response regulator transcription factor [Pseudomonadales bacterium]MCP5302200.1 response regulator transcription factor [Pseudomonadales bacterium]